MKILFFLALLANLVFFLWQYNAGAFQHVTDDVELATPQPKQIWLLSESEKKPSVNIVKNPILPTTMIITAPAAVMTRAPKNNPPVNIVKKPILPATMSITAPATIMTRAIKNNPQHLVTSTVINNVNPATATAKNTQ